MLVGVWFLSRGPPMWGGIQCGHDVKGWPRRMTSRWGESADAVRESFEAEVPELVMGSIEIVVIARLPRIRCKVAVRCHDPKIDAIGLCVGRGGERIKRIIARLENERIDVIRWSDSAIELITRALSPAKILGITLDEDRHRALVRVGQAQSLLAAGPGNSNRELAVSLTGWSIDFEIDGP